jgi:Rad3-related DNA helicase
VKPKLFPSSLAPREGQLEAIEKIQTAFDGGKHFFVLEGPTGFGKSAIAKATLNMCGKGFITSPVNSLVSQYSEDESLGLAEVRGQSTYACRAFEGVNCEKAGESFEDHSTKCQDYVLARDAFWMAKHSVTNVHFLCYASPVQGGFYPRDVLVIDEAHNLENILITMGRRTITVEDINLIHGQPLDLPEADKELLNLGRVTDWLRQFESHITYALRNIEDEDEKRNYENLRRAINFTLNCGDWITWKEKDNLVIAPMSAKRAARSLFRCAGRVLFMSATMGNVSLFLKNLGIDENDAAFHRADCRFPQSNRKVFYSNCGSMSKTQNQPGMSRMLQACSSVLRDRPDERGIIHCHSRTLQLGVSHHLMGEFGKRILTHGTGSDRDAGIQRLRQSRNGVLCAVGMTEGLDLPDEDARFCIFAKVPWPNLSDPYVAERRKRSQSWYENLAALSIIQGTGRVVRSTTDYADTFIFDSSFERLLPRFPQWWKSAVVMNARVR